MVAKYLVAAYIPGPCTRRPCTTRRWWRIGYRAERPRKGAGTALGEAKFLCNGKGNGDRRQQRAAKHRTLNTGDAKMQYSKSSLTTWRKRERTSREDAQPLHEAGRVE